MKIIIEKLQLGNIEIIKVSKLEGHISESVSYQYKEENGKVRCL